MPEKFDDILAILGNENKRLHSSAQIGIRLVEDFFKKRQLFRRRLRDFPIGTVGQVGGDVRDFKTTEFPSAKLLSSAKTKDK